ncbi:MAG: glycosyltransferase family 4 protein [Actinomycetales bacterium]|nr:glycosyltransferase family 4 protein [Actinomycetales bacterium]
MKTVLTDLLFYTGTRGGMESYVREVYSRVQEHSPQLRFVGLASKELAAAGAPWFPGELIDSGISSKSSVRWAMAEILLPARVASRIHADVIHSPANIGPIFSRVPVVLTIQDVLSFRHPEFIPGVPGAILRWLIRAASKNARRILTISAASAADIIAFLDVEPQGITVIPLAGSGTNGHAVTAATTDVDADARAKEAGAQHVILSGGNRLPHKNFETLLRALAIIPENIRPRLIITGGPISDPLVPLVQELNVGDWVDLRGWVTADELTELYATATVYVFPTRFEGFGLPVLEAMARGCPVICSDIPVLREVGGDAAIFADTTDARVLAQQIGALLSNPTLQKQARNRGLERAKMFSWDTTAAETAKVFADI